MMHVEMDHWLNDSIGEEISLWIEREGFSGKLLRHDDDVIVIEMRYGRGTVEADLPTELAVLKTAIRAWALPPQYSKVAP